MLIATYEEHEFVNQLNDWIIQSETLNEMSGELVSRIKGVFRVRTFSETASGDNASLKSSIERTIEEIESFKDEHLYCLIFEDDFEDEDKAMLAHDVIEKQFPGIDSLEVYLCASQHFSNGHALVRVRIFRSETNELKQFAAAYRGKTAEEIINAAA